MITPQVYYLLHLIDQEVSCLSHIQGIIVVGTVTGEIKILTDDSLIEQHYFKDEHVL